MARDTVKACKTPGCKKVMKGVNENREYCDRCKYWQGVKDKKRSRMRANRTGYEKFTKGYNK